MKLSLKTLCFLLVFNSIWSQKSTSNSISEIRNEIQQKNYKNAEILLAKNYSSNPNDLETIWLYAQVSHWNSNNNLSKSLFEKAINLNQKNTALKLDYSRMLYESGKLIQALQLISEIKQDPSVNAEALLMEASINFWMGNIEQAKKTISLINNLYPNSEITKELEKNISEVTSLQLKTNFEYQTDNQPLTYNHENIELKQYHSWFWSPKIEISNYYFQPTQSAYFGKIENSIFLFNLGLTSSISIGAYKNNTNITDWIGGIGLNKKINKDFDIKIGYDKKPYVSTVASTSISLSQNNLFCDLNYSNLNYFSIHSGYNYQYFTDTNSINTINIWGISKPYILSGFKLQFGYGYYFSNAKNNLYSSKLSLNEITSNFNISNTIEGFYYPYFTPNSLTTNSAILILNYNINKNIHFETKGNYGFYANCNNPYFYLDSDTSGNTVLTKNYSSTNFHPFELSSTINSQINANLNLKVGFIHQSTFFYNRNNFNIEVVYKL